MGHVPAASPQQLPLVVRLGDVAAKASKVENRPPPLLLEKLRRDKLLLWLQGMWLRMKQP
jgi:hypothetical protein